MHDGLAPSSAFRWLRVFLVISLAVLAVVLSGCAEKKELRIARTEAVNVEAVLVNTTHVVQGLLENASISSFRHVKKELMVLRDAWSRYQKHPAYQDKHDGPLPQGEHNKPNASDKPGNHSANESLPIKEDTSLDKDIFWTNVSNGTKLPPYGPYDYKEQKGAAISPGDDIYLYAIGSSSIVWMTWIDQLHLYLKRLGYKTPTVNADTKTRYTAKTVPTCDDSEWFEPLKTARFGRIGWGSWDFAYEGWEGCEDGFREVNNVSIKCQHGPGCHFSKNPYPLSKMAGNAAKSNVTLLTTWFNDDQQGWSQFKCFNHTRVNGLETANISITNLLRTVRSIHRANPETWVLVLSKYPQVYLHVSPGWFRALNLRVKEAVEKEPRTLFVDYYMPPDYVSDMYQVAHRGHPNCQGSKVMAYAVIRRLYEAQVISRSIDFRPKQLANGNCSTLLNADCHSSVLCWVEPVEGTCAAYSKGTDHWHWVKAG